MNQLTLPRAACAAVWLLGLAHATRADAHGIAGARVFVTTLTVDDPAVADEASLPTFSWMLQGADGGPGQTNEYNLNVEWDKRITEHFGLGFNSGFTALQTLNDKTRYGWQDLVVTAKYQAYVSAAHEFMLSVGVVREFGRTGTASIGADQYGFTQPTVYFGKGLGDLPIGWLRPLAITGELGFAAADVALKQNPDGSFNNGYANRWVGGMSIQYSIPYLQSQVKDLGLPGWLGRMTPLVEITWSSPTQRPNNLPMQLLFAPGVVYSGDTWQFGIEALIPGNSNTGKHVGVIAQYHLFFDDLFPHSLGKPVVDWFR
ncbi:hypothetical protein [Limobrevibacterium gyesilva]|uniref:Uncharacterized protein n=1 Tax=Limobrevibacterium gyesilva TaxID=2991712 RepID=A0AA41YL16_9PROT|nr:hypothetical protein [Limobrevibacterium gyesilva]MCW3475814.1 hypothetical protein [Limobrevibacterium gyesilva]